MCYAKTKDPRDWKSFQMVLDYSFATFHDEHGEWFGYCDREGKPRITLKEDRTRVAFICPGPYTFSEVLNGLLEP